MIIEKWFDAVFGRSYKTWVSEPRAEAGCLSLK